MYLFCFEKPYENIAQAWHDSNAGVKHEQKLKKTPIIKYGGYGAYGKKLANRKVRHARIDVVANRKSYRKMYETWNINDCITWWVREDAERCGMKDVWERLYHRE